MQKVQSTSITKLNQCIWGMLKNNGTIFKSSINKANKRKFAALCIFDSNTNTLANSLEEVLFSTAEEVLGRQRKKIQPWVTNEVLDQCNQKWQLKQQKYTSTESGLEYRKVNREVSEKMKAAMEEWTEEQCKNVEKGMMSGNSKEAYNTLKALTKIQQRKLAVVKDSSANILMESTAVLNQSIEYCSGLYNNELQPDTSPLRSSQHPT